MFYILCGQQPEATCVLMKAPFHLDLVPFGSICTELQTHKWPFGRKDTFRPTGVEECLTSELTCTAFDQNGEPSLVSLVTPIGMR